jgi:hypothetical protein
MVACCTHPTARRLRALAPCSLSPRHDFRTCLHPAYTRLPGGIEPLGLSTPTDLKSVPGTIRAQVGNWPYRQVILKRQMSREEFSCTVLAPCLFVWKY